MSAPDDFLRYPNRRPGLDHHWFEHSVAKERPALRWPGGARMAVWINVPIEFFPLDAPAQPFRPLGAVDRTYPDFWTFSNRDYGNRVGVYRIMRVLDSLGLRATASMNSDVARRYPRLVEEIVRRDWEIVASGVNMGRLHHEGLARDDEAALIAESVTTFGAASGQAIHGWHSPAHSQSMRTLELVAAAGLSYVADWINDDLPYRMNTAAGTIDALPLTHEWSDRNILVQHDLSIEDYESQVLDAFRCLDAEAHTGGGRVLSLSVTPWIIGYPHRVQGLARVLKTILASGSVWPVTGMELMQEFRRQVPPA